MQPTIKRKRFLLRPLKMSDADSVVTYIGDRDVSRNMLAVPYPYQKKDFVDWFRGLHNKKNPSELFFGIEIDNEIVGGISLKDIQGHKAEIGYWLAKKHWKKGIMTEIVGIVTNYGFSKLKLKRIVAPIFTRNKRSARVLEKNGYKLEGILKKYYLKNGRYIDCAMYAKVK